MPVFNLRKIACYKTDDYDQVDELRILVTVDDAKKYRFRHTITAMQAWVLNRSYNFEHSMQVQLWEDDHEDATLIGQLNINAESSKNETKEVEYEKGNAEYTLVYTLSQLPEKAKPKIKRVAVKPKSKPEFHNLPTTDNKPNVKKTKEIEKPVPSPKTKRNRKGLKLFTPSEHGFNFANVFKISSLGIRFPFLPKFAKTFGLCGGMSLTAADFYFHNKKLPTFKAVPQSGTMFKHLFARQIESFGANFKYLGKFFKWWMLYSTLQTQQDTLKEWSKLRKRLDAGKPTVLGLVYVDASTGKLWDNHQVLAYDYEQASNTLLYINIYDPNYPKRDDVYIKAELNTAQTINKNIDRLVCEQHIPNLKVKNIRGFFTTKIQAKEPTMDVIEAGEV